MSDTPVPDIRAARENKGWDQAELARLLGVGQQTVSRWERGQTAPRGEVLGRLRAVLGLDDAVTPPRRPLLEELPFNRLDAYQFEAFCEALASRLYPHAQEVLRYGVSGDDQHGIDVRVVTADGERIGIQCKKYEKFQPASFAKAVSALDRDRARVDRCVLFLSTRASAAVREACEKLDEWTIWDSRTLSLKVAELPRDQALSLLSRFFPDMREEFLGERAPSVWQTPEEAFPESLPSPVYSHRFRLVGRTETLAEMNAFAVADDTPQIAVLIGSAGQGKSRLLRELAHEQADRPGTSVRVLPPGPFTPNDLEQLPASGRLLVIVEDAHERSDDLAMVVTGVIRTRPSARVVIATRPYGRHVVQQALRAAKVSETAVPRWSLSGLRLEDAQVLAAEILGMERVHAARVVAEVTADSPLLLVNTATAVRDGKLIIDTLRSDGDVRQLLLDVFVSSALSKSAHPADDRALLHAVAALQPVATDVAHFREALSGILEIPFPRILSRLQSLESTGIVVRRGASVRISPDLLGDVLLAEAAVHDGSATGYLQVVRDCAQGDALANALVNAGRVDWQGTAHGSHRVRVLDPLWAVLETEFTEGDAYTRVRLLPLLRKIAPFQPERIFALVEWALDHPAAKSERLDEVLGIPTTYEQADVVREVPRVLEAVAVDLDLLRPVYELLWSLRHRDKRPPHQNPDAPLRILLNLAAYVPGKPLAYQEILLDALSDWVEEAAPDPVTRMPLALLDPLFASIAEGITTEGYTLTLSRYPLRAEVVAPIRKRAADLLLAQYASESEKHAAAAARSVAEVLRHQTEDFESYNVKFLRELGTLTAALRPRPLVSLATRRSLSWAAEHGPVPIREAAQAVLHSLPDTTEHRLAILLHTGAYDRMLVAKTEDAMRLESAQEYRKTLSDATIDELKKQPAGQAAGLLLSLVDAGRHVLAKHSEGVHMTLDEVLAELPEMATPLLNQLVAAEDDTITIMLPAVLQALLQQDDRHAVSVCRRLVDDGNPAAAWAVAQSLRSFIKEPSVQDAGGLELARTLVCHSDPAVQAGALDMAVSLLGTSKDTALELLTSVPFGETGVVPRRLWWVFTADGLVSWQDLTEFQRSFFLKQLTGLPALDDYDVQKFVAHIASADAQNAARLLRARLERWEATSLAQDFDPLPMEWDVPLPFSESPERMDLLRSVRDWLAQPREHAWRRELHASNFFWTVAGPADRPVLGFLLGPYQDGDIDLAMASAPLLSGLPTHILWEDVNFVSALLKAADRLSKELLRRTGASLRAAVFSGVRSRSLGAPYQEDVEVVEHVQRIRAGLPRGSVVDLFYKALQEKAQYEIDRVMSDDFNER
jgi:transcriptional regulator with XRE-family HTH domain